MKQARRAFALFSFLLVSALPSLPLAAAEAHHARDFALPDLNGKKVRLSDFRNKVVLVDFWATWCVPCRNELPDLKTLYKNRKDQGFAILGVSLDDGGQATVSKFVKDNEVPYPIVLAGGTEQVPEGYEIEGLPMAYLIDGQGIIRKRYAGQIDPKELEQDVSQLLNKKG